MRTSSVFRGLSFQTLRGSVEVAMSNGSGIRDPQFEVSAQYLAIRAPAAQACGSSNSSSSGSSNSSSSSSGSSGSSSIINSTTLDRPPGRS